MIAIRPADAADEPRILALLAASGLPSDDLRASAVALWVAERAGDIVGVVGLQGFGDAALLRSLAVDAIQRGAGLGAALLAHAQARAQADGTRELFLLTETATDFFAAHGYRVIAREQVPADVRGSAQFRSLCPASAVCMAKAL